MNIIFMGTPEFSVQILNALVKAGHNIICVYSQPPRPAGRGHKLQPSAVHSRADELGIPVRTPLSLKKSAEARAEFAALKADVAIVAAYGLILPQEVLDAPKYGCINVHASLLPRWRGAAPIQRAILAGDTESGVCIMQMEAGLDTGPVLMRGTVPITNATTASTLHDALAAQGAALTIKTLAQIDTLKAEAQPEDGVTYASMLTKEDGRIDWTKPAAEIERQMRALTPWPGVWCLHGDQRMKVLEAEVAVAAGKPGRSGPDVNSGAVPAPGEILHRNLTVACGSGALLLKKVQPQDRKPMDGASFMNGTHANVGDTLT